MLIFHFFFFNINFNQVTYLLAKRLIQSSPNKMRLWYKLSEMHYHNFDQTSQCQWHQPIVSFYKENIEVDHRYHFDTHCYFSHHTHNIVRLKVHFEALLDLWIYSIRKTLDYTVKMAQFLSITTEKAKCWIRMSYTKNIEEHKSDKIKLTSIH